jgi:hypothetical protein
MSVLRKTYDGFEKTSIAEQLKYIQSKIWKPRKVNVVANSETNKRFALEVPEYSHDFRNFRVTGDLSNFQHLECVTLSHSGFPLDTLSTIGSNGELNFCCASGYSFLPPFEYYQIAVDFQFSHTWSEGLFNDFELWCDETLSTFEGYLIHRKQNVQEVEFLGEHFMWREMHFICPRGLPVHNLTIELLEGDQFYSCEVFTTC